MHCAWKIWKSTMSNKAFVSKKKKKTKLTVKQDTVLYGCDYSSSSQVLLQQDHTRWENKICEGKRSIEKNNNNLLNYKMQVGALGNRTCGVLTPPTSPSKSPASISSVPLHPAFNTVRASITGAGSFFRKIWFTSCHARRPPCSIQICTHTGTSWLVTLIAYSCSGKFFIHRFTYICSKPVLESCERVDRREVCSGIANLWSKNNCKKFIQQTPIFGKFFIHRFTYVANLYLSLVNG